MLSKSKRKFIKKTYANRPGEARIVTALFESAAALETQFGADICDLDTECLQIAINEAIRNNICNEKIAVGAISSYRKWQHGLDVPEEIAGFKVSVDPVVKVRRTMVSSPRHLKRTLESAFPMMHENTSDIIFAAFLWMGYMGLSAEQSIRVRVRDVFLDELYIRCDGCNYRIYKESAQIFRSAIALKYLNDSKIVNGKKVLYTYERMSGEEILRNRQSIRGQMDQSKIISSFRPTITRKFLELEERDIRIGRIRSFPYDFSYEKAVESGLFYRAFKTEHITKKAYGFEKEADIKLKHKHEEWPAPEEWSAEHKLEIDRHSVNRYRRVYRTKYALWKLAFYAE